MHKEPSLALNHGVGESTIRDNLGKYGQEGDCATHVYADTMCLEDCGPARN